MHKTYLILGSIAIVLAFVGLMLNYGATGNFVRITPQSAASPTASSQSPQASDVTPKKTNVDCTNKDYFRVNMDATKKVYNKVLLDGNLYLGDDLVAYKEAIYLNNLKCTKKDINCKDNCLNTQFMTLNDEEFGYALNYTLPPGKSLASYNYQNYTLMGFLGQTLIIKEVANNAMLSGIVGNKVTLTAGESVKIGTHNVKFIEASANKALIEIDGEKFSQTEGSTMISNKGIDIYILTVFDSTNEDLVEIVIGYYGLFANGIAYVDEDKVHYLWKWNLAGMNALMPSVGVTLAEDFDDTANTLNENITALKLTKSNRQYLIAGDYLCLPYKYACLKIEKISEKGPCLVSVGTSCDSKIK